MIVTLYTLPDGAKSVVDIDIDPRDEAVFLEHGVILSMEMLRTGAHALYAMPSTSTDEDDELCHVVFGHDIVEGFTELRKMYEQTYLDK